MSTYKSGRPGMLSSPQRAAALDSAATQTEPRISGYRIMRKLGEGGQGQVWLAVREADGIRSAVKVLPTLHACNQHARARFELSIATLAALDHAGIIRSIEFGQLPSGELWHATEYIAGHTLLQYLDDVDTQNRARRHRDSRLPLEAILRLFVRICEAVEAAHRVGVIHRDLKPSNVIVDEQGRPRLLDFGHAKPLATAGLADLTVTGEFIGSPAYASPEQVRCQPNTLDVRTDVYAIGVMLYQCLTGTFPYDVNGPLARTFEQIQFAGPTPPRAHAPWIDRDLQAIVLKAIAKERGRRYESVSDLRQDIGRRLSGRAVSARGDSPWYQFRKLVRRHRVASAAAITILTFTIAYAATMRVLYRRAARAEASALAHATDARHKFSVAQQALDFVLTQVDSKLERVAGMGELRTALLGDVYAHMQALTAAGTARSELNADPEMSAIVAAVHLKLGDMDFVLNRVDDALQHRMAALNIWNRLVRDHPDRAEYQERCSIAHVLVGDIDKMRLRPREALAQYQQALDIDERLVAKYPKNLTFLDNLSWSYERMAGFASDADERRALHAKRHAIACRLVALDSANSLRRHNLSISHMFQAKYVRATDRAAFVAHVDAALELATQISNAEPLHALYCFTYTMAAFLALDEPLRTGNVQPAVELLNQIMERADAIHRREPVTRLGFLLGQRVDAARATIASLHGANAPAGMDLRGLIPRKFELDGDDGAAASSPAVPPP